MVKFFCEYPLLVESSGVYFGFYLAPVAYGSGVIECSHLFVFSGITQMLKFLN